MLDNLPLNRGFFERFTIYDDKVNCYKKRITQDFTESEKIIVST